MSNSNRLKLTFISFFSYALTGALITVTGLLLNDIAAYFGVKATDMSNTFTFLNAGLLLAIFLNVWLMEKITLRIQLMVGFALMFIAVIGLIFAQSLAMFSACMFIFGIVSGITMSIGTFLITQIYHGRQRGAWLLFTDSFFSMAGILFTSVAVFILTHDQAWYWVYASIGSVYAGIFILTLMSEFPVVAPKAEESTAPAEKEKWGIAAPILCVAALCYILGQLVFISWVPSYAIDAESGLGLSQVEAGRLVQSFWTSYMVGMWIFSFVLRFFDLQRIVTVLALLSTSAMFFFVTSESTAYLVYMMFALGLVSSAIYTTLITLGSQQTKLPSPKLVNLVLTFGTVGTCLTFIVSAPIVEHFGVHAALMTAVCLYAVVTIMSFLLGFVTKHRDHGHAAH